MEISSSQRIKQEIQLLILIHETLSLLLPRSAYPKEVDQPDQFGRTPLMFTVLADRLDCAEVLIKKGANVDARDNGGRTALHWATYKVCLHCYILQ